MEQWRHIHHADSQLPPLLLKASFGSQGYSVRLTDLSRVWTETLGRKDIINQAKRISCSIDPGEDNEQFDIFLDNVRSALDQNDKTSLALASTKTNSLKLILENPLPAPLPAFEWEINLKRAPDECVKDEIVSPLMQKAHQLNHNLELLIAELQAKDKIIAKITDRLETSGHDLTAVFPGVANVKLSRNKPQQEQLARHVRGLGQFEEDAFRKQIAARSEDAVMPSESADVLFASLSTATEGAETAHQDTDWWRWISPGKPVNLAKDTSEHADKSRRDVAGSGERSDQREASDTAQDDGFQRQATPPNLRSERQQVRANSNDDIEMRDDVPRPSSLRDRYQYGVEDESTDDEDDLDGQVQRSRPPPKRTSPTIAPPREPTPKSPSPPPVPKPSSHVPFTHDEDTETEDSDDDLDKPSQPSQKTAASSQLPSRQRTQTPQPAAPSPRKKLGTLGGRARTTEPPPSPPDNEPIESEPAPAPKSKPKLGTLGGKKSQPQKPRSKTPSRSPSPKPLSKRPGIIGGKRAASPSSLSEPKHDDLETSTTRASRRQASPPAAALAMTEDERADAKREALRKELDAKAKAPVKKKRKF
ncbi:hypothetical protein Q7P37_004373 [Cladosporium fusiforme]